MLEVKFENCSYVKLLKDYNGKYIIERKVNVDKEVMVSSFTRNSVTLVQFVNYVNMMVMNVVTNCMIESNDRVRL